jgi:surface antigen
VLRRGATAVKTAYDEPLNEPVPARLLAAVGPGEPAIESKVMPLQMRKRWLDRSKSMALAASMAALAIGFGAGYWQARPSGGFHLAGAPADGTESGQYEAALYQALEEGNADTRVAYVDNASGRPGVVTIVGSVAVGVSSNCLEFRREWRDAANKVVSRGLACRADSGDWSVLSMPPKPAS